MEPAPARRGRKKSGGRNGGSGNPAPADDGDGPEGGELDGEEDDEDEIPDFDGSGGEE